MGETRTRTDRLKEGGGDANATDMSFAEAWDRVEALLDGLDHSSPEGRLDAEALRVLIACGRFA